MHQFSTKPYLLCTIVHKSGKSGVLKSNLAKQQLQFSKVAENTSGVRVSLGQTLWKVSGFPPLTTIKFKLRIPKLLVSYVLSFLNISTEAAGWEHSSTTVIRLCSMLTSMHRAPHLSPHRCLQSSAGSHSHRQIDSPAKTSSPAVNDRRSHTVRNPCNTNRSSYQS